MFKFLRAAGASDARHGLSGRRLWVFSLLFLLAGFLLISAGQPRHVSGEIEPVPVAPGFRSVIRGLEEEVRAFVIELRKGELLKARIEQQGLDGKIVLLDPRRVTIAEVDTYSGTHGTEVLLARADRRGLYEIRVVPFGGDGYIRFQVEHVGGDFSADEALLEARELGGRALDDPDAADALGQAIEALPPSIDVLEVARLQATLGESQRHFYRLGEAADAYEEALAAIECHGNDWELGWILDEYNSLLLDLGRFGAVRPRLEQARRLWTRLGDAETLSGIWNGFGILHAGLGEHSAALEAYVKALELAQSRSARATILRNLAKLNLSMGKLEEGAEELRRQVESAERMEAESFDSEAIALAYTSLASVHGQLASRSGASRRRAHLAQARADFGRAEDLLSPESPAFGLLLQERAAFTLRHDGEADDADVRAALDDLGRSRQLVELDERERAFLFLHEAEAQRRLGELDAASSSIERARGLFETLRMRHLLLATHAEEARIFRAAGELGEARQALEGAISLAESMRLSLQLDRHRKAQQDVNFDLYLELIELLAQTDDPEAAFDAAERARARSFLDALTAPSLERDRDRHLIELSAEIEMLIEQRTLAARDGELRRAEELASSIDEKQEEIDRQKGAHLEHLGLEVPQAAPFSAQQVQAQLDDETTLLSFVLGEEKSWLFRVTRDELELLPRPGRARLERLVALASKTLTGAGEHVHPGEWLPELAPLAEALLGGSRLDTERLAIVPDGALLEVPFLALPEPGRASPRPLLAKHELVRLPSASALVHVRRRAARQVLPEGLLGVVADPVFDADDERIIGGLPRVGGKDSKAGAYPRLRQSGFEATSIAALMRQYDVAVFQDFAAGGEDLLQRLGDFRWLHVATHTDFDPEHPDQMGLVVSMVGPDGERRPGFIHHGEIARLDMAAELVTLSTCESALGESVRGENVNGLSQAFFAAGASRVVATLWRISDSEHTAELMEIFYAGLMAGRTPPAALRDAQWALASRGVPPHFWAAYVMIGPWDPLAPLPAPRVRTAGTVESDATRRIEDSR